MGGRRTFVTSTALNVVRPMSWQHLLFVGESRSWNKTSTTSHWTASQRNKINSVYYERSFHSLFFISVLATTSVGSILKDSDNSQLKLHEHLEPHLIPRPSSWSKSNACIGRVNITWKMCQFESTSKWEKYECEFVARKLWNHIHYCERIFLDRNYFQEWCAYFHI